MNEEATTKPKDKKPYEPPEPRLPGSVNCKIPRPWRAVFYAACVEAGQTPYAFTQAAVRERLERLGKLKPERTVTDDAITGMW